MMIDSHVHHWQISRGDYGWLTPELDAIYRDFGPDDFCAIRQDYGIERAILVQAAPTIAETRYLLGLADTHDYIAGVVGWVDFEAEDACAQIETLARHEKLVGLRPMIQDITDDDWMLRPDFARVFECIRQTGLCFDVLVLPRHLGNLRRLINRYPDMKIVIDHGAKPFIRQGLISPWKEDIRLCAEAPNVFCKLSGLMTEAAKDCGLSDLAPYVDHLLSCFGSERLLWGSDWPVVNLKADYGRWLELSRVLLAGLGKRQWQDVFGGNAASFYGVS